MWQEMFQQLKVRDIKALARSISFVENEQPGYQQFLESLHPPVHSKIIGITGPPGAGKSTLTDGLISELINKNKRVAVLCIDPSSPFNLGALLGDRIRMSDWYTHPDIYIRSLASRGSVGGLHPKIIEITELLKAAGFDYILVETVGVGQSEIEIVGLADTTIVVMVPEGGDEIQTMKSGLMEIADIFVVNKADRPDADLFVKNLRLMLAPSFSTHKTEVPILKTIATQKQGIGVLMESIEQHQATLQQNDKRNWLFAERAWQIIQQHRMKNISKDQLATEIGLAADTSSFNLYGFVKKYL
jgi:LAO/AO transport system kinase